MHVCNVVRGKTAANAAGIPVSPSVTAIRMSLRPRVFRSLNTFIQNLAPSVVSIQSPRISREPSRQTPMPGTPLCCARRCLPEPSPAMRRRRQGIDRLQRPRLPGRDLREHAVGDRADQVGAHLVAIAFSQIALNSRTVRPRAYKVTMLSSNAVNRRACLGTAKARNCRPGRAGSRSALCRHRSSPSWR